MQNDRTAELRGAITRESFSCNEDELLIVLYTLRRLRLGRERYGFMHVAEDKRDLSLEMFEEAADGTVYGAQRVLKFRLLERHGGDMSALIQEALDYDPDP